MNHDNENFNVFGFYDRKDSYVKICMNPIKKGESVMATYGDFNNFGMFLNYGFTSGKLEDCRWDGVFQLPTNIPYYTEKLQMTSLL